MRSRRFPSCVAAALGACAAAIALAGCAASEAETVRAQAAQSFACPSDNVRVVRLKELDSATTSYQVEGCGSTGVYTCRTTVEATGATAGRQSGREMATRCRAGASWAE